MKVSLNWVRQFTDIDISVDQLIEKIGIQLGAIEEVVDLGKKYQGVLIAKVVSCEKHPNADKLSVCWIDDGGVAKDVDRNEQGFVQVVCGAPNVRAGLTVAWLPPGSTVPSSLDKDPFVLSSRELRGVMSNGMLASGSELSISEDHNGIVELELEAAPGSSFADVYGLNDHVIDIENKMFTHRPDCFGILGVAREIAGIQHKPFTSPDWYKQPLGRIQPGKSRLDLKVTNNVPDLVPRFTAIAMADVTVKPSPLVLQTYLSRVGIRPINNLVDITNYLMVLTGQPLHAYDADKLRALGARDKGQGISLETRMSRRGDTIKLLNGKDLTLKDENTVLITSNNVPVGIAGAMGGADTEVDENTNDMVIECANFDMYSVRRASMKYGLFTDAVTRFNKGQSKLQNDRVIEEAVALVQSIAAGHVASELIDLRGDLIESPAISVSAQFVNERLGSDLGIKDMASLLQNVEFLVEIHRDELHITPPFWRTDIEIPEDIVEEVGRLYGYDQLPQTLLIRNISPITPEPMLSLKKSLREKLSSGGANEVLTYGFVHGNLLDKTSQDIKKAFKLSNAISPDLQYYRLSLTPSLLEKVHPNIKAGYPEFAVFEIGKVHGKDEVDDSKLPKEFERISLVLAKDNRTANGHGAPYYQAKYYAEYVLGLETNQLRYVRLDELGDLGHAMFNQLIAPFELTRSAAVYYNEMLLGVVGEYKNSVIRALKLPNYCAGFELFLNPLIKIESGSGYTVSPRFPKTEQDITLRLPTTISYQELEKVIMAKLRTLDDMYASLKVVSIFQKDDDSEHKQVTFRLTLTSYNKTLKTDEVNRILSEIAAEAKTVLGASRV